LEKREEREYRGAIAICFASHALPTKGKGEKKGTRGRRKKKGEKRGGRRQRTDLVY